MRRVLAILLLATLAACASHPAGPAGVRFGLHPAPSYPPDLPKGWRGDCDAPANARQAATLNATAIDSLPVAPFGHTETGWRTYAVLTAHEIGAVCGPETAGFAEALARWKVAHGLAYDGTMDDLTLQKLKGAWQEKRPFLMARVRKEPCPDPPDLTVLAETEPWESHYGKPILVRADVLAAYRRMAAVARAAMPGLAADAMALTIFSGYRSPEYDAAQCAQQGGCNGVTRAGGCSAHRTGTALDIVIGAAPGARVDTATDANRRYLSQTEVYRWLVANAERYGFVNYAYEPWHWEYVGDLAGQPFSARRPSPPPTYQAKAFH